MTPGFRPRSRPRSAKKRGLGDGRDHRRHDPRLGARTARAAAAAIASSWRSSMPGSRSAMRSPRTPSAGFASSLHAGELQRLVRAGVERADDDLAPGERLEDLGVDRRLLLDGRLRRRGRGSTARCGTGRRPRRCALRRALRAPAPSCTLASTSTRVPSARPGPGRARIAGRSASAAASTRRPAVVPRRRPGRGRPSPVARRPARSCPPGRVEPGDGDDAGDAQLAGDDRGVAGRAAEPGGERRR